MSTNFSIVDKLRQGDKAAKKQFYLQHFDQMVRIPLRYVSSKNEAITIVNDGFLKVYGSIANLQDDSKVVHWAASIIKNTTLDYVRKKVKYNKKVTQLDGDSSVAISNNAALQSLAMEEIMKLIHSLADTERVVFSMYAIDGYKHAEIASTLDISEGTSKWYLNKARTNLKSLLKQYIS